ncbi:MAG: 4Fe-4S dicluster domain-containing protein [Clostridia bacterium]
MLKAFDTKVQFMKYKVLREVAKRGFEDRLLDCYPEIPKLLINDKPSMRCCIYKERAIIEERTRMAMGGDKTNPNVIEVLPIACDDCPASGYEVGHDCRGCLAHRCESVCRFGAITFDENQKAHIDKSKCVNCGQCAKVCPYSAIANKKRPCEIACKVGAIKTKEGTSECVIDNDKCISCGACVYQCPFGAIVDKSFILDVVKLIKESENNTKYRVYAVVAPSISSQFSYAKLGQVITGLKKLGFFHVIEAALGADMVAYKEAKELVEKGFLTSSCCPAFVDYIHKSFPKMTKHISHNFSPMAEIAKYIKDSTAEECKIVFIGPCTAKKMEFQKENVRPYVDSVITFEELQALIDSQDIDLSEQAEDVLDNASYYGRIFARSGGLSDAVGQALKEQNSNFPANPLPCDGIEECKIALLKASKNVSKHNFIEGMACVGGCIGGAGCLTHGIKDKNEVDKYGKLAMEKTIIDAIGILGVET